MELPERVRGFGLTLRIGEGGNRLSLAFPF